MAALYLVVLGVSFLGRVALLVRSVANVDWSPAHLAGVFALGTLYDLAAASYLALPVVLYLLVVPDRWLRARWHRALTAAGLFAGIYVLIFVTAAEWTFWTEFQTRFNFIAIDYLIYTQEVLDNIVESYPVGPLLVALLIPTAVAFLLVRRVLPGAIPPARSSWTNRLAVFATLIALPVLATATLSNRAIPRLGSSANQELARNGIYSFFAAFRNNEIDYATFYGTLDDDRAFARARELVRTDNSRFLEDDPHDLARWIQNDGTPRDLNVIQITVESLSSEFLGTFGNLDGLTPELDRLAADGMLFTNFHATGTRTARGMEALSLSLPPTPGRSIVKRPDNAHLFTLGSVFRERGYDTAFLYGGRSTFDGMNRFFAGNGYRVVDLQTKSDADVTFTTAWGACDADLFRWTMEEADRAHAAGQPFFHFVMTTSNHRPFRYPDGVIDIPSGTGRAGAVKYTDHAIGEFIREASGHPWFANTVFVIVADHCASSAGRDDLPVRRYEIPLIVYNPGLIPARRIDRLSSQIDYPPTLLGLLNISYRSRFYGRDILRMTDADERALVATYQKLGLLEGGRLAVLKPVREDDVYSVDTRTGDLTHLADEGPLIDDTVVYYQTASELFARGEYREFAPPDDPSAGPVAGLLEPPR